MKKIMSPVITAPGSTAGSQAQLKSSVKVRGIAGDQPEIKPVENDEVFDHLFLQKYRSLTIRHKMAA
jgi:hypothetical protein